MEHPLCMQRLQTVKKICPKLEYLRSLKWLVGDSALDKLTLEVSICKFLDYTAPGPFVAIAVCILLDERYVRMEAQPSLVLLQFGYSRRVAEDLLRILRSRLD